MEFYKSIKSDVQFGALRFDEKKNNNKVSTLFGTMAAHTDTNCINLFGARAAIQIKRLFHFSSFFFIWKVSF